VSSALALVDALDEPISGALDPRICVEHKDKRPESEEARQRQAVAYLRKHAKRVIVFAVPNATRGSGSKLKQHREGAIYGAADLVCVWAGGTAFIEMKAGTTMPRANQVAFLNSLAQREQHVAVCRSAEGVASFLSVVGAPVPVLS
jgi:hypothetical protein